MPSNLLHYISTIKNTKFFAFLATSEHNQQPESALAMRKDMVIIGDNFCLICTMRQLWGITMYWF